MCPGYTFVDDEAYKDGMIETIQESLHSLRGYIEREEFAGYDPYDALNSPLLSRLNLGSKYIRIAFIQFLKRSPVNLRPLLLVRKGYNPKGLGLFLWSYARLYAVDKDPDCLERIDKLLGLICDSKSSGCTGNGWGYNFDWQNRAFFVPKGTPTIVNSAFVGHALLDTWELTGKEQALELALPIQDFILRDLRRHQEPDSLCFSYTPLDRYFVHNANMLGASLLIRLFGHTGEEECRETALASLTYSMNHQHEHGSWYYAERESSHWIDSFHTGFNLQAIRYFLEVGYGKEWQEGYERGVRFYCDHFFLEDGTPKYYHDRLYPIDIHSPAQAVVFLSGMGRNYQALTDKVASWMITNMQDPSGYFYFQIHPHYTNRIPYMRWGQAWAFHALTEYLRNR